MMPAAEGRDETMKYVVTINGQQYEVEVEKGTATLIETAAAAAVPAPAAPQPAAVQSTPPTLQGERLLAPMPGVVVKIRAAVGERVKRGQPLLILEAMKMENEVVSTSEGVVAFLVASGAQVGAGDVLAVIRRASAAGNDNEPFDHSRGEE